MCNLMDDDDNVEIMKCKFAPEFKQFLGEFCAINAC